MPHHILLIPILLAILSTAAPENQKKVAAITKAAGSSLLAPLLDQLSTDLREVTSDKLILQYQPVGSGTGLVSVLDSSVEWAASEVPLQDADILTNVPPSESILHIPISASAIVVSYNLPQQITQPLNLTPDLVAQIFAKNITRWNDPKIVTKNPLLQDLDQEIIVVRRAGMETFGNSFSCFCCLSAPFPRVHNRFPTDQIPDVSGSTFVFSDFLTSASKLWPFGRTLIPAWPLGQTQAALGNQGKPLWKILGN